MCKMEDTRNGRNYKTTSSKCTPHKIRTSDLDNMVIESIIMQVKAVLNIEKTIKQMKKENAITNKKEYEDNVIKLQENLEKIKKMKRLSYENWKLNKITKEEFLSSSNDYENKIEKCKSDIKKYEKEIKNALNDAKCEEYWIEHFRRNKKIKTLSRDVIEELIDCIYVYEGGNITIKFKYQDEYARDISQKVRSVLDSKKANGQFIGSYAPYGYLRNPKDKYKFIVDKEAEKVVKKYLI